MNAASRLFVIAGIFAALASTVRAEERVFLLQLGSYETRAEAQSRYITLSETYPDLFEGLSLRLLDVTLPPDNFTVYRTQAGALPSRADAQLVCEKLAARGDECYVVETAMFNPDEMQKPTAAALPTQASAVPAAQSLTAMPTAATQAPTLASEMQAMEAELSQQLPMPTLQQPETPTLVAAAGLPAGAGLNAPVATLGAAPEHELVAMPEAFPDLPPAPLAAPAIAPTRSFWSRLNPFASDEEEVAVAAAPIVPDAFEPVGVPQIAAPQTIMDASPTPLRLPPPPLNAASTDALRADNPPLPPAPPLITTQGKRVPVAAESAAALPTNLPFAVKTRDGQPAALPAAAAPDPQFVAAGDEVRVSEAVPVPVTNELPQSAPEPYTAAQLRALGTPSQPAVAGKNLWAEIKFFDTQQAALAFWNEFRTLNRDFPPARVRLINSYATSGTQRARVALRVGPFEHDAAVSTICAQVRGDGAHCQAVRELGQSIATSRDAASNSRNRELRQVRTTRGTH